MELYHKKNLKQCNKIKTYLAFYGLQKGKKTHWNQDGTNFYDTNSRNQKILKSNGKTKVCAGTSESSTVWTL